MQKSVLLKGMCSSHKSHDTISTSPLSWCGAVWKSARQQMRGRVGALGSGRDLVRLERAGREAQASREARGDRCGSRHFEREERVAAFADVAVVRVFGGEGRRVGAEDHEA